MLSYEAGTKDKFMDGQLLASGSVSLYQQWSNRPSVTLPSCAFRYTVNQGGAKSVRFDRTKANGL